MADLSVEQWSSALLKRLGIKQTPGAMQALVGWARAEGGHYNNSARFNPLNTTQPEPGAGNTGSQGNIKVYKNWDQGLQATVETLRNGRYQPILQALKSGNPGRVASAIGQTPWGTSGGLVTRTIMGTKVNPAVVADVPAAPRTTAHPAGVAAPPAPAGPPVTPAGENRQQLLQQYLATRGRPGGTLALAQGLGSLAAPASASGAAPAAAAPPPPIGGGASAALGWATSKLGSQETGTNSGGIAGYANKRFGMSNQPWCAMFTSLAVTKGGAPLSARSASVADVLAKAQRGDGYQRGYVAPTAARPGDLIAFGTEHIGMVKRVLPGGRIDMVAGNDSNGVHERTVSTGGNVKIVRPKYGGR